MNLSLPLAAAALMLTLPVAAEIYRCDIDGTATFSDRPCGPDSTPHSGGRGVSFIQPDENLPALAEAARTFIRERREQMAQRRPPRQHADSSASVSTHPRVETILLPWTSTGVPHGRPWRIPRQGQGKSEPPVIADNDRYSPLNGPILGTRHDSAAFEYAPRIPVGSRQRRSQ
ncbi:MAG: hypothetical protein U5L08_04760 [Xanthomonadales bacterium]|nr:hypothetical protein [Xanthomonadales bacterium]